MAEVEEGYYESAPRLEDRPSLRSAVLRFMDKSAINMITNEYQIGSEELIAEIRYWQGQLDGDDYYSPRARVEMDNFIVSLVFEVLQRQQVSNDTRDEIDAFNWDLRAYE